MATDVVPTVPKPKLRWFQFSLRTLLMFVTVCAAVCSGLSFKWRVEQQRKVIQQEFQQFGACVNWDTAHWWSTEVTSASFTPNAYLHLNRMFAGDELTDDQLDQLRPRLQYVETLYLDGTLVTDRGLEHFEDMKELRELGLASTAVTDSGLSHLSQLAQLESLNLCATGIPNRAIAWYGRFAARDELKVAFASKVTDAGIAHLRRLTKLRGLSLRMTEITDSGLVHLESLSNLETLDLGGTHVTEGAVRKLQQALPNCKIQL